MNEEALLKDYQSIYAEYGYEIRKSLDVQNLMKIEENLKNLEHIADKYWTIVKFVNNNIIGKFLLKKILKRTGLGA